MWQTLHSYGARKVAVFGLGLLGELPEIVARFGSNSSVMDTAVKLFNTELQPRVNDLNSELSGAKFTYIDSYEISRNLSTGTIKSNLFRYVGFTPESFDALT